MDLAVLAHIGHHWTSILYVIPFVVFFVLVFRERSRSRRARAEAEASAAQPEASAARRPGEPTPLEPR